MRRRGVRFAYVTGVILIVAGLVAPMVGALADHPGSVGIERAGRVSGGGGGSEPGLIGSYTLTVLPGVGETAAFCIDRGEASPHNSGDWRNVRPTTTNPADWDANPLRGKNGTVADARTAAMVGYVVATWGDSLDDTTAAAVSLLVHEMLVGEPTSLPPTVTERNLANLMWLIASQQAGPYTVTVTPVGSGLITPGDRREFRVRVLSAAGFPVQGAQVEWGILGDAFLLTSGPVTDANGEAAVLVEQPTVGQSLVAANVWLPSFPSGWAHFTGGQESTWMQRVIIPARSWYGGWSGIGAGVPVEVFKSDRVTGGPLAGAVFDVLDDAGRVVGTVGPTGPDGRAVSPEIFGFGSYTVRERVAPIGYSLVPGVPVTVNEGRRTRPVLNIPNDIILGELRVRKTAPPGVTPPADLTGYTFTVTDNSSGAVIATLTTGPDGLTPPVQVRPGAYTITETGIPPGSPFTLDPNPRTVTVEPGGQTVTFSFPNRTWLTVDTNATRTDRLTGEANRDVIRVGGNSTGDRVNITVDVHGPFPNRPRDEDCVLSNRVYTWGTTLDGNGEVTSDPMGPFNQPGWWAFRVTVTRPADITEVVHGCGNTAEQFKVRPVPEVSTRTEPGPEVLVGDQVRDIVTVSNIGDGETGTAVVRLYGPLTGPQREEENCRDAEVAAEFEVAVTGNGDFPTGWYTVGKPGRYVWVHDFTRASDRWTHPGSCQDTAEQFLVRTVPVITTQVSAQEVVTGGSVADDITVNGLSEGEQLTVNVDVYGPFPEPPTSEEQCNSSTRTATLGPITITENGTFRSPPMTPTLAGVYVFVERAVRDVDDWEGEGSCLNRAETFTVTTPPPPTTTTTVATTTTTTVTTTTVPETTTTTVPVVTVPSPTTVPTGVLASSTVISQGGTLPRTGSPTGLLTWIGVLLIGTGTVTVLIGTRLNQPRSR